MYLKRYRAASVRDALRQAREDLGPDALVLSTQTVGASGWRGWVGASEVEVTAAAERVASESRPGASAGRHAAGVELAARLSAGGVDPALAREVVDAMPPRRRRSASLHSLRATLAERLAALAVGDEPLARIEMFVGPPGVGKTTTIAKIAAQARARQGRRIGLIAADAFRVGAVEQLRLFADIIGVPFRVARTADELNEALQSGRGPVLVDTAGRSPKDRAAQDLFRTVARRSDARVHLVMAADTGAAAARRIHDAYADAHPSRVVITKLDETDSLSPLVTALRDWQLPISYLGTGQRVPDDLTRATAELVAASVLGDLGVEGRTHP